MPSSETCYDTKYKDNGIWYTGTACCRVRLPCTRQPTPNPVLHHLPHPTPSSSPHRPLSHPTIPPSYPDISVQKKNNIRSIYRLYIYSMDLKTVSKGKRSKGRIKKLPSYSHQPPLFRAPGRNRVGSEQAHFLRDKKRGGSVCGGSMGQFLREKR